MAKMWMQTEKKQFDTSNGMLKCAKLNMEEQSINDEVSVSAACPNNDVLRGVTWCYQLPISRPVLAVWSFTA